jgi:hypothetical protein
MDYSLEKLSFQYNLPLRVLYCIDYIKRNNISNETVKEDFKFIRHIERAYTNLFNNYVKEGKIILSKTSNYYAIKGYKRRGEIGTIMAIKYLVNMLKYEYKIFSYDLNKYKGLVEKYFNNNYILWFEYNKYNIYRYSVYYVFTGYERPSKKYIYNTDKKYYKIIKNINNY